MLFYTKICPSVFHLVHILGNFHSALHFIKWPWINVGFFLVFFLMCNTCISFLFFQKAFFNIFKEDWRSLIPRWQLKAVKEWGQQRGTSSEKQSFLPRCWVCFQFRLWTQDGCVSFYRYFSSKSTKPGLGMCSLGASLSPKMEITQSVQRFIKYWRVLKFLKSF